jgi:hypothetical protein
MSWLTNNAAPLLNIFGICCDIAGAFLVASEVVRQFHGDKYRGSAQMSFDSSIVITQQAQETEEFQAWDAKKYRNMKFGLTLLSLGFILQIIANVMQLK